MNRINIEEELKTIIQELEGAKTAGGAFVARDPSPARQIAELVQMTREGMIELTLRVHLDPPGVEVRKTYLNKNIETWSMQTTLEALRTTLEARPD